MLLPKRYPGPCVLTPNQSNQTGLVVYVAEMICGGTPRLKWKGGAAVPILSDYQARPGTPGRGVPLTRAGTGGRGYPPPTLPQYPRTNRVHRRRHFKKKRIFPAGTHRGYPRFIPEQGEGVGPTPLPFPYETPAGVSSP